MRPTAGGLAATLALEPHREGGFFRETYRSAETVRTARGERAAATAILFLITPSSPSRFHRLLSDELWVFQGGLPLELVTIAAGEEAQVRLLGDPATDHSAQPQALVPAGTWQAARVAGALPERSSEASTVADGAGAGERSWSLVSCVVTPGFSFDDFELGQRDALLDLCPGGEGLIIALT